MWQAFDTGTLRVYGRYGTATEAWSVVYRCRAGVVMHVAWESSIVV